jgi:hypothetical protein
MNIYWANCCSLVLAMFLGAVGCGPKRTMQQASQALDAPRTEERLAGARDLEGFARDGTPLTPEVVDRLLTKFPSESDPKTRGAMITALGYTGDPRVEAPLSDYLQTNDPDQQRWAARAYKKYVVKTGKYPAGFDFPENWPYGTTGFPPPASR